MPKYEIDRKFNLILQIESIRWIVSSFLQFLLKNIKNRGGENNLCNSKKCSNFAKLLPGCNVRLCWFV